MLAHTFFRVAGGKITYYPLALPRPNEPICFVLQKYFLNSTM